MGARSISAKQLRADCTTLERAVLSARLGTKESLAAYRPGGASNPQRGADGWLTYYRHLHRTHAKGDASPFGANLSRDAADRAVLDAMRGEPIPVRLTGRDEDAPPVYVHAKSLGALLHVHDLDRQLAYMTEMHARLVSMKTAESVERLGRVLRGISYTYALLAWVVTHPGPGMPYRAEDPQPEPPPWILDLEPWHMIRICEAHHQHLLRLHAVASLIDNRGQTEENGQRPSWSMFAASAAEMFGTDPIVVMNDRSLASQLAAMRLAAASKTPPEKERA